MLLIGQEIDRQWQPTPGQHRDQTLVAKRTDQAIEGHGRDMIEHRAQLQTEPTMRGQQGITGDLGAHRRYRKTKWGRTVNTALHVVHWIRQMVSPPRRTRT